MQAVWTLALVIFVVAGLALGDDADCAPKPPSPGQKHVHPDDCCKVNNILPTTMKASKDKCKEKYPMMKPLGPPPSGPPPSGPPPTPSAEMKLAHACMVECIFSEEGLLTTDKKLDSTAVAKYFTPSDATLAAATTPAITKCLASYVSNVDTSLECKSGAHEFKKCLMRETFLSCPTSLWTASSDCEEFKAKVTKCPNMPIMLGKPPKRPPGM